jgi:hypothetical protein
VTYGLAAIQATVDHFVPEKKTELSRWYIHELRDRHLLLHGDPVLDVSYNLEQWTEKNDRHAPTSVDSYVRPPSRAERRRQKFGR